MTKVRLFAQCEHFEEFSVFRILHENEINFYFSEARNCPSVAAHHTKKDFFQPSTVEEICKCLISQYLLLSKDDLELWDSDPEQYGKNFEFILFSIKRNIQHNSYRNHQLIQFHKHN